LMILKPRFTYVSPLGK